MLDAGRGPLPLHPPNVQQPVLHPQDAPSEVPEDEDEGKFQDLVPAHRTTDQLVCGRPSAVMPFEITP